MSLRRPAPARSLIWLRDSSTPIFVINPQQRVVLFNRGCEQVSGWPAEQILGQKVVLTTTSEENCLEAFLSAIRPPELVWQGHALRCPIVWTHPQQSAESRIVQFWPILGTKEHGLLAILGIVELETPTVKSSAYPLSELDVSAELALLRFEHRRRFGEKSLIGNCPALQKVLTQAQLARQTNTTVLLQGEQGTGKEHLARSIFSGSASNANAFLVFNCRLTPTLELKSHLKRMLESRQSPGDRSESATATWYLADVDAMSADIQERLIEVLSLPVAERPIRVLASTTVPLEPLIESGAFSRELWYLLSSLVIELPPLRDRGSDIRLLGQYLIEECNRGQERQVHGLSESVIQAFERYRWPGNLDELRKVIESAHAVCNSSLIETEHLPFHFRAGTDAQRLGPVLPRKRSLDQQLEATEREEIEKAFRETQGNMTLTAELLQINRARLYRRMEQLGLRTTETPHPRLDPHPDEPQS